MQNYHSVVSSAKAFIAEAEAYEKRPTKAGSKRLRKQMQEIKSAVTPAKAELIAADKAAS